MTSSERAQVLVAARFLRAAERSDGFSVVLTLLAVIVVAIRVYPFSAGFVAALGLVERYFALRISFDARLLEDIAAEHFSTEEMDGALSAMGLVKAGKSGRPWTDRCRGAKRLVTIHESIIGAQIAAVVVLAIRMLMQ